MNMPPSYDVTVIGAGPGGYVAAICAAQLGLKVCLVEKEKAGGVCLNWGCIPSKNLLHQASLLASAKELEAIGVSVNTDGLDYTKVHKKSRQATQRLVKGVEFLLKKNKVDFIQGAAKITDPNLVTLEDDRAIFSRFIIIATGSRPFPLPGFEFDEERVLSSNGILTMTQLPKRLVILGAGAIGCEFAYVMNTFGVQVTLVEMADHILPLEDDETVAVLAQLFKKNGINIMTGTKALSQTKTQSGVSVKLQKKDGELVTVQTEKVLCVFGRIPNTENLGLDRIGIQTDRGYIPVGDYGQTSVSSIYAIGDVVQTPLLAHVASKEGEIAAAHIAGHKTDRAIDIHEVPSAIFCEPQIAGFGLRESHAVSNHLPYQKVIFPYRGIGKAIAIGKPDGMIKILFHPETKHILGAHIVGHDATELIHEVLLAKSANLNPGQVARMMHAHPTVSELVMEGMRSVGGSPIHA